ncbi:MAG: hypothetical protein KZQ66_06330 [Candidatus Thiodiazotropha sp. (ex Lucinoma aequizonata)]|nr:hypothetical protein [Candidatus Thiodiazotropha sp. (ex Lucinoma aequizonata)]MCU7895901.1 hypothetical protein [Candidatus Thiodiazotropha sp. (ex Lucinoma aequizonata)]MCU7900063.1 hypothetical protein [Candidatus Thiodiazotropha sp. (ex Lucinoma aequizonata)]MCU7901654.1 hypothetical protein [Candidatus Thiodiazotropha sp. (ex Lucinoma aequizonata)]MCU7908308.1 hypothetical protein [Candidatus Thiodiazotropha sp. (ex Lucinoma aequizonata)]
MPKKRKSRDQDGIYERSDSPCYWASFIDASGQRVRRSTGIKKSIEGRREAEALLAKWRLQAHHERQWDAEQERSFEEVMLGFLQAHKHKRSAEKDRAHTKRLRRILGDRVMNGLAPKDIRLYITERRTEGVSDSSINRELALLSAAINFANLE